MNKLYIVVAYDYDNQPVNKAVFFDKCEANTFISNTDFYSQGYNCVLVQEASYSGNGVWIVD